MRSALLCLFVFLTGCRCLPNHEPTEIKYAAADHYGFSLVCTPDGHAQWLFINYGGGTMVTVLGDHGEPLGCDHVERTYHIRRSN
jgi:hypothetical protein